MNISKADAIAQLARWYDAQTPVRTVYRTITGQLLATGKINELSPASMKIGSTDWEMLLYFRETSQYDYNDARQAFTEHNKDRSDKYPVFIKVKFSNNDEVE